MLSKIKELIVARVEVKKAIEDYINNNRLKLNEVAHLVHETQNNFDNVTSFHKTVTPKYQYGFHVDINLNVTAQWEEHWRYGGYDSGIVDFPLSFIYNQEELDQWVKEMNDKTQDIINEEKEKANKKYRAELEAKALKYQKLLEKENEISS